MRILRVLVQLVLELAKVHQFADRRIVIRSNLDKVKVLFFRQRKRIADLHNAKLLIIVGNYTDFPRPNFSINPLPVYLQPPAGSAKPGILSTSAPIVKAIDAILLYHAVPQFKQYLAGAQRLITPDSYRQGTYSRLSNGLRGHARRLPRTIIKLETVVKKREFV